MNHLAVFPNGIPVTNAFGQFVLRSIIQDGTDMGIVVEIQPNVFKLESKTLDIPKIIQQFSKKLKTAWNILVQHKDELTETSPMLYKDMIQLSNEDLNGRSLHSRLDNFQRRGLICRTKVKGHINGYYFPTEVLNFLNSTMGESSLASQGSSSSSVTGQVE
jgi:hypothetical protein